jgi:hypothetical protein
MICDILVIVAVVAIPLLGSSSYSSVSALPSFSTIDHHKAFVKNQDSSSSSSGDTSTSGMSKGTSNDDGDRDTAVVIITVGLEEAAAMITSWSFV